MRQVGIVATVEASARSRLDEIVEEVRSKNVEVLDGLRRIGLISGRCEVSVMPAIATWRRVAGVETSASIEMGPSGSPIQ